MGAHSLRFSKEGTFHITVFSDLHFAEYENTAQGAKQDSRTAAVVRKVLQHEASTQLVVLNGDLISGYGTTSDNATRYLDQVLAPIQALGLPWAVTYGNHDNERFARSRELLDYESRTYPNYSLTRNMGPRDSEAGVSNYYLEVFAAETSHVPEMLLWFFDSRGGAQPHDWVHDSWFIDTNANLTQKYNKEVPSIAFFHIPITATYDFQVNPGVDTSREPGINGEKVWWQGRGYDGKTGHDLKFMTALSATEGMLATFSGHDHDNDCSRCFKWKSPSATSSSAGLNVCYGRHTGYGGYGSLARGARQILLKQSTIKDEVVTWIRLEDGLVPENVTLNATYGQDEYHPHHLPQRTELKRNINMVEEMSQGTQPHLPTLYLLSLVLFWWKVNW
ncbi:Metallo-dependent phosphatase-like protein [Aspergillus tetrazonus]